MFQSPLPSPTPWISNIKHRWLIFGDMNVYNCSGIIYRHISVWSHHSVTRTYSSNSVCLLQFSPFQCHCLNTYNATSLLVNLTFDLWKPSPALAAFTKFAANLRLIYPIFQTGCWLQDNSLTFPKPKLPPAPKGTATDYNPKSSLTLQGSTNFHKLSLCTGDFPLNSI